MIELGAQIGCVDKSIYGNHNQSEPRSNGVPIGITAKSSSVLPSRPRCSMDHRFACPARIKNQFRSAVQWRQCYGTQAHAVGTVPSQLVAVTLIDTPLAAAPAAKLRRLQYGRKSEQLDHQIKSSNCNFKTCRPTTPRQNGKCRRQTLLRTSAHHANRCRTICRATCKSTCSRPMFARHAVAGCTTYVKTWSRSLRSRRPASAWSAICALS